MSYITFYNLGESADLGSQIQQYASLYAIAKENNKEIVFAESDINKGWGIKFKNLLQIPFNVVPDHFIKNFQPVRPPDAIVNNIDLNLEADKNYIFTNLFHTHHYWNPKYREDVYNWKWNEEYYKKAIENINKLKQEGKELVSIHVRRGDYLKHDHFCKLDTEYYGDALEDFISEIEKYHFVVFSNDIEWCKENLIEGSMVTFMEQGIDYVDLITMSLCDHNIIANSSFSWWAAFKNSNPNKKIVCPANYIRSYSSYAFLNGNYYLPEWKSIYNSVI